MVDEINTKRPRTLVCGDIHGNYLGLKQALERSNFDYENDTLIQLGDIVDGGPDTFECVEELLKIKKLISIKGNHDEWFREWLISGIHPDGWRQGGHKTARSYLKQIGKENLIQVKSSGSYLVALNPYDVPVLHQKLFSSQLLFRIDDENRLFVHGGFQRNDTLKDQARHKPWTLYWDRDLWEQALSYEAMMPANKAFIKFKIKDNFKEVYIGHTCTVFWGQNIPMRAANIWNLDTGGGSRKGKITIMDIDTKEYWQSDLTSELYPYDQGRGF
ncbi:calcineurin-like phosphoesterase [Leptolyngbya phage Lbo-JY46]